MKRKDWTKEKLIIEALLPLGYGRESLHKKLVELGFTIGEVKVGQLINEVRNQYTQTQLEGKLLRVVIGS